MGTSRVPTSSARGTRESLNLGYGHNTPKETQMNPHNTTPPRLDDETRSALPTVEAARHLNRAPYTLRLWACKDNGPIRPLRIQGRLAWPVNALRQLLSGAKD